MDRKRTKIQPKKGKILFSINNFNLTEKFKFKFRIKMKIG